MADRRIPFNDITRLAAAHAALDPDRLEWRSDILISSLIEILAQKGAQDERQLRNQIKSMWLTDIVDRRLLRAALERAEQNDLVHRRTNSRDVKWEVRSSIASDAKSDRAWAESVVERFKQDLGKRLPELLDDDRPVEPSRLRDYSYYLIGAFVAGSKRIFWGVVRSGDPESLNGIDFDLPASWAYLDAKQLPKEIGNALKALAVAALEAGDEFGTEILRLIVAGQVLQGMLGHRDLDGVNWVEGSTLVLDTSVLIYRLDRSGPQNRLLNELLQMSRDARCTIIVTRAVIEEWKRLWQSAAHDAQVLASKYTGLPPRLILEAKNPMLRNWQFGSMTWADYERRHNSIESWLAGHNIEIVEDERADPDLIERMREELLRLSGEARKTMRTEAAALTDAVSAATVAKVRTVNSSQAPTAWFIAEDHFTDEAYRLICPNDKFPVASTIEVWLLLLSMARTDQPRRAGELAEAIGEAVIQKSFLAVSAGYSVSELIEITEVLTRNDDDDEQALAEAFRTDFLALAKLSSPDVSSELLRRRANRRDWQAQRREQYVNARAQEMDERVQESQRRFEDLHAANVRLRRTLWLVVALVALTSSVAAAGLAGAGVWLITGGAVLVAAVGFEGLRWRRQPEVKAGWFVISIVITFLWVLLGAVISLALL